jgi:alpha-ribazole phosphatase/probable phosphoglycerate mutase
VTRLYLIRHGNTLDEETKKVYKGRLDIPLSRAGIERMERAATFLASSGMSKVLTSTLSRSIESGRIVAAAQGLAIERDPAFDEVSFGVWEGLSFSEIKERYPEALARWIEDPGMHPPPQGESFAEARERSMTRLKEVIAENAGKTLCIVAHAGIIRIMLFSLLDFRLTRLFRLGQDYGCVNIVDIYEDGNTTLNLLNFTYY